MLGTNQIIIAILLLGGFLTLGYEAFYWFTHVYEDNARVQTDITNISAQVNGKIEDVLVKEGSSVKKGQLLAVLHHDDIRLKIKSLQTNLSLERAKRAKLMAEKSVFIADLRSKMDTQKAKIKALMQESLSIDSRLKLANGNLSRVKLLVKRKLKPETEFIAEKDKLLALQGEGTLLDGRILVAQQEFNQLKSARNQVSII